MFPTLFYDFFLFYGVHPATKRQLEGNDGPPVKKRRLQPKMSSYFSATPEENQMNSTCPSGNREEEDEKWKTCSKHNRLSPKYLQ